MKILESKFVQGFIKMANDGYLQGWHERNGGNLSYRLKAEEVEMIRPRLNAPGEWTLSVLRFRDWPEILQRVRGDTKSVAMAFAGSAAYVNGEYMLIDAPELAFELLKRPEQRDRMREAIRQVTGRVYRLGLTAGPRRTPKRAGPTPGRAGTPCAGAGRGPADRASQQPLLRSPKRRGPALNRRGDPF